MKLNKLSEDIKWDRDPIEYASNVLADRREWFVEIPPYTFIKMGDDIIDQFISWTKGFLLYNNDQKSISDGLKAIENANMTVDIYNSPDSLFYKLIDQTSADTTVFHDDDEFVGGNFIPIKISSDKVFSSHDTRVRFGIHATQKIRKILEDIKPTLRKEFLSVSEYVSSLTSTPKPTKRDIGR